MRPLVSQSEDWLWTKLGPVVETLESLPMNDRGNLGYPAARSSREEALNLEGSGSG